MTSCKIMTDSFTPPRTDRFARRNAPLEERDEVRRPRVVRVIFRASGSATRKVDFSLSVARVRALRRDDESLQLNDSWRSMLDHEKLTMMQTRVFAFRSVPCHLVAMTGWTER